VQDLQSLAGHCGGGKDGIRHDCVLEMKKAAFAALDSLVTKLW
jgi:hypothetical protein